MPSQHGYGGQEPGQHDNRPIIPRSEPFLEEKLADVGNITLGYFLNRGLGQEVKVARGHPKWYDLLLVNIDHLKDQLPNSDLQHFPQ